MLGMIPLRVDVANTSDPGARRTPTSSKALSAATNYGRASLYQSQVQEEDMTYPHLSVCRSLHMEVQIASPSVKVVRHQHLQTFRSLPVFYENDKVSGQIILDPACNHSGRLSISIEGAFEYISSQSEALDHLYGENRGNSPHVFFSSTNVIPVGTSSDSMNPRTPAFIREAFLTHARKRPSISSMSSVKDAIRDGSSRSFPFVFDMPLGRQAGQEMPPTFSTSTLVTTGTRGRAFVEKAGVSYKVTALWEPSDGYENRALLEVPVLYQPDNDFQSLDATIAQPEFWLEMPLSSEISIPFNCGITLPSPGNFPRTSTVPYYVIFTTTPRSSTLAREIATNAVISVALVRQVTISAPQSLPPTPPLTPSSSASDSDSSITPRKTHRRIFSRVARSAPTILQRPPRIPEEITSPMSKPLPRVPSQPFFESRALLTDIHKGFPKRPRARGNRSRSIPMDTISSLPDGLYKGEIQLNREMLPGIDWPGVEVKVRHFVASFIYNLSGKLMLSLSVLPGSLRCVPSRQDQGTHTDTNILKAEYY